MAEKSSTNADTDADGVSNAHWALRELAAALPGQVLLPGDPGWAQESIGWNLAVAQNPAAVVTVTDVEDVVATVRCAAANGLAVSAQPIGHGATTAVDGVILLRTRALNEISIDVPSAVARVGAGVKWGELLARTEEFGLTGLAGSSPDPSVVGFSVGGGLSWFGRAYGLAAHSVLAIELVDAVGAQRRVTATNDPDLFWALRGGGGDFGIVTAMEIGLHPAAHIYGGRLLWPIEMARPVLRAFRDLTAMAPDELTAWAHLLRFPSLPQVPTPMRGRAFVSVDIAFLGSAHDGERLLAPLRELPAQWMDTIATVPLSQLGGIADEPVDPMPFMEMAGLLGGLDNAAIDALLQAAGADSGSALTIVQIRHLGGAFARASEADGPAGAIVEPYHLFGLGVPMSAESGAAIGTSFEALRQALNGYLTGGICFNFLGADDNPAAAFSGSALRRLRQVKQHVDPRRVFRSNRPVSRPAHNSADR